MGAARLIDLPRALRCGRHDVVFYMPSVGSSVCAPGSAPTGGAETQVLMLATALARQGQRIGIVAYGRADELPGEVDGVAMIGRPAYRRGSNLVGKLREIFMTWRALWSAPSRTVVARCAGAQVGLVSVYARFARRRFVFASSNLADFDSRELLAKRRDRLIYRLGIRLADAIVVQTEEQAGLCRATFRRQPVLIKSIAAPAEQQSGEPAAFLWVGRLVSYKRPLEYVELARAVPEARFWMVGVPGPPDEETLAEAVTTASAELPNLELLSPRPHSELGKLMSRAVASVNTADFEGMPNALLEAWSRGVPALVLTHDPGGVIAAHGLGAFARGSPDALAVAARELWETRTRRGELAERCRAYVRHHHSPEFVAAQWREVLMPWGGRT